LNDTISDLQAATAPHAWFPIACFAVGGLGTFGFAVFGLRPALVGAGKAAQYAPWIICSSAVTRLPTAGTARNRRSGLGRPLWEMQPGDADAYFGRVLRDARPSTRTGRAAALTVYFQFLELRHKVELHNVTGRVIECPLDEMNRPGASAGPQLRVPPAEAEVGQLFAGGGRSWPLAASSSRPPATTWSPGWRPTWGCGSTRPGCWTWMTCGGSWAGSAS
jgi:hypothetical protein